MAVRLEKSEVATLISLVTPEIGRCSEPKSETSSYPYRLIGMRKKLLTMLIDGGHSSGFSDEGLPEFRKYARRKYRAELNEDLITMIED